MQNPWARVWEGSCTYIYIYICIYIFKHIYIYLDVYNTHTHKHNVAHVHPWRKPASLLFARFPAVALQPWKHRLSPSHWAGWACECTSVHLIRGTGTPEIRIGFLVMGYPFRASFLGVRFLKWWIFFWFPPPKRVTSTQTHTQRSMNSNCPLVDISIWSGVHCSRGLPIKMCRLKRSQAKKHGTQAGVQFRGAASAEPQFQGLLGFLLGLFF